MTKYSGCFGSACGGWYITSCWAIRSPAIRSIGPDGMTSLNEPSARVTVHVGPARELSIIGYMSSTRFSFMTAAVTIPASGLPNSLSVILPVRTIPFTHANSTSICSYPAVSFASAWLGR